MLRTRMFVFVLIAAAFTGLALLEFLYFPGRSQRAMREVLEAKAVAVAELTAYSVGTALEFDDHDVVREYLTGAARDRDLRYIAVFDAKGGVFEAIKRPDATVARLPPGVPKTTLRELGGDLYVLTPLVAPKPYPSVVVAYSEAGIRAQSRESEQTALRIALAITGLGIGVAFWIIALSQRHHQAALARERAEAASKAKSDFVARVSHEIRTPLNGVLGIADLLMRTELGGRQRQLVRTLQRSGRHLLGVINDILDLSKIEAGELVLRAERVDVADVMEDAAELAASQLKPGVELYTELDPELPHAMQGDSQRLLQVFTNLLGNAIKFTSSGEIRLAADVLEVGPESFRLRFSVRDSGIGISKAAQARLFQSFYQAGDASKNYGGTGLGLSISQELVERMGGRISVESDTGKGSEFSFELALAVLEPALPVDQGLAGLSLLILARSALADSLAALAGTFGMESSGVETPAAALAALEQSPALDVVVIDTDVPGADDDLAHVVLERWPALRVLFVERSNDYVEPTEPGTDTLVKPVRRAAFLDAVAGLVGRTERSSRAPGPTSRPVRDRRSSIPMRGTVLAAEDNPTNQEVLRALLEELGCAVDIQRNGVEVVRAFETGGPYCMVLMDCQMPELDGYAAARQLRAIEAKEQRQRLPILALTAGTPAEVERDALSAGMDDVLAKPIGLEVLKQALTRWCRSAGEELPLDPARAVELLRLQTPARPRFVKDLVARFLADAEPLLATLERAAKSGNHEELREAAHALKGSSRNLGAKPLSALCEALERRASAGVLDGFESTVAGVARELGRAREALERFSAGV